MTRDIETSPTLLGVAGAAVPLGFAAGSAATLCVREWRQHARTGPVPDWPQRGPSRAMAMRRQSGCGEHPGKQIPKHSARQETTEQHARFGHGRSLLGIRRQLRLLLFQKLLLVVGHNLGCRPRLDVTSPCEKNNVVAHCELPNTQRSAMAASVINAEQLRRTLSPCGPAMCCSNRSSSRIVLRPASSRAILALLSHPDGQCSGRTAHRWAQTRRRGRQCWAWRAGRFRMPGAQCIAPTRPACGHPCPCTPAPRRSAGKPCWPSAARWTWGQVGRDPVP